MIFDPSSPTYTLNLFSKKSYSYINKPFDTIDILFYIEIVLKYIYFLWSHYLLQIKLLIDLFGSDFPNYINRFLIIYNIYSINNNVRYILKAWLNKDHILNSITNIYINSSWCERECWDLFGMFFFFNLDLRRLLNDYGFHGHPLKKDFPLSGFLETSFLYIINFVSYYKIKLVQEFRFFFLLSPWKYDVV